VSPEGVAHTGSPPKWLCTRTHRIQMSMSGCEIGSGGGILMETCKVLTKACLRCLIKEKTSVKQTLVLALMHSSSFISSILVSLGTKKLFVFTLCSLKSFFKQLFCFFLQTNFLLCLLVIL
jgi:hypothetical protein